MGHGSPGRLRRGLWRLRLEICGLVNISKHTVRMPSRLSKELYELLNGIDAGAQQAGLLDGNAEG